MHLLIVSLHTSPTAPLGTGDAGGMNAVLQAQAPELARLGHTVDLVTRRDGTDEPDAEPLGPRITLHRITAGPPRPLPKSEIDDHLDEFRDGLDALGLRPDVVHSHHWMSGVAALPLARRWGVPHLQTYHSVAAPSGSPLSHGEPPESGRRVPGEALIARESDLVVAVSERERRTIIDRCGARPDRVVVNHPGVDLDLFRPRRPGEDPWRPEGVPLERPLAVFAARLQPLKAADLAIAALAGIPPERRPVLAIAGDVSADFAGYWSELQTMIDDLGLGGDIVHIGAQPRPDLARLLRSSSVLLVPSHSETFGLISLEGQASGIPVLAATSGGLPEAMGDGGILLDSRDPGVWSAELDRVLHHPAVADDLSRRARAHAEKFGWPGRVLELSQIYRSGRAMTALLAPLLNESVSRALFLHAHPDDETLSTGALIAALATSGVECQVLTCTRGERGEIVAGVLPPDTGPAELTRWRLGELTAACAELGVSRHAFLGTPPALAEGCDERGYRDSGMRWVTPVLAGPSSDAGPDALTSRPLADAVSDSLALIAVWRPDVLVSYDLGGGYGHPDHVRTAEVALEAARDSGIPLLQVVTGRPDDATWLHLGDEGGRVRRALGRYRSQLSVDGDDVVHVGGQRQAIDTGVGLRRAVL